MTAEVKDAQFYGVPQRRRRLILLAGLHGKILFAPRARCTRTVRQAFAKLGARRAKRDALHNLPEQRSERVVQIIKRIPKDGGSRADLGDEWQLDCHRRCDGFKDIYGRMSWDNVAPTITCGCCNPSKGRFLHPTEDRNITLREAALLQSFPSDYFFSLDRGKFPAAQMIGNALPPEFLRRQAVQVRRHISSNESKA